MKQKKRVPRSTPPPPPPPSVINLRGVTWPWFIGAVVAVGAISTTVVQYEKAHSVIEPFWFSSRAYVRDTADMVTTKKVEPISKWMGDYEAYRLEQSLETTKLKKVALEQNLLLAKLEYAKTPDSHILRDAVERLTRQVAEASKDIEEYTAALFTRRKKL